MLATNNNTAFRIHNYKKNYFKYILDNRHLFISTLINIITNKIVIPKMKTNSTKTIFKTNENNYHPTK